ncbi:hypothetical protein A7985_09495 [Pseudoalteromonas luteoviolacea]|uniref:DUF418 domain-containing protein n=1 Tax=Pseudoalteromonas luteoviolacea TaxID=43657 RepID=A0A1C0TRY2_9GAMM|nr:DUF418 domain-containing protein [Pseudoalteromonas luteoviolacea]OCQ22028.1 hypothetical protein A7985_09495 [Pseudoalteromonas luteoviolacea]
MGRIALVDALRGFALLGLPLTNLAYMADFNNGYAANSESVIDSLLTAFIDVVAQGRFRTLFSILFGFSMCLYLDKYGPLTFARKALARLYALGVIGLVHGFLIWPGDILFNYALSGLLLIYVIKTDSKTLLKLSLCAVTLPILLLVYLAMAFPEPSVQEGVSSFGSENPWLGLLSFLKQNAANYLDMLMLLPFLTLWYTFGLMLIGVLVYRAHWFQGNALSSSLSVVVLIPLALIGSALTRWYLFQEHRIVFEVLNWLFAIPFCLALISLAIHFSTIVERYSGLLVASGQYSLSLYLLQSVIGVAIFHIILQNLQLDLRQIHFLAIFGGLTVLQLSLVWSLAHWKIMGPAEKLFTNLQGWFHKRVVK